MSLKYGLHLPQGFAHELAGITNPVEAYKTLTHLAQTADQSGYDSVWIADHLITNPPSQEMVFECWTYESIHRTVLTHCSIAETDEQARAQIPAWAGRFPRRYWLLWSRWHHADLQRASGCL